MTYKDKLVYLINEYKKGNYDTETFCDQFMQTYYYDDEADAKKTKYLEKLSKLAYACARYSDDAHKYPVGVYTSKSDINCLIKELEEK